jgi:catechol 2,3-dioxygenase-like lactoylglutathione lyase family enzyme
MPVPVPGSERTSPRMSPLVSLRHVAIAVPDFEDTVGFYSGPWALSTVESEPGVAYFGSPGTSENYILRVRKAAERRLDLIAFRVNDRVTLESVAERLAGQGVRIISDPADLETPGGGYGFRFFDPDGRVVELSTEVAERESRQLEEGESVPRKLSHVVVNSPDLDATKKFYEDLLGFRLSDWLDDRVCFLRCATDHHTVAIARSPHASINHISFEMRGVDEYMRGTGRMMRYGRSPIWGPGRHNAGDNTFSYFLDPNHNVVEYTTALQQITDDASWVPHRWDSGPLESDQWGTATMTDEFFPSSRGVPDPGVWIEPPL